MTSQERYEVRYQLDELIKVKMLLESAVGCNDEAIVGQYGGHSVLLGNLIEHNVSLDIPASAMKIIYNANIESIDKTIEHLNRLKNNETGN